MLSHYGCLNIQAISLENILMILESNLYGLMGPRVLFLLPLNDYLTYFVFQIYINLLVVILIFLYVNLFNFIMRDYKNI